MEINTLICLIIIAIGGFLRLRMRYDRILSWGMFIAVAFLFWNYCEGALENKNLGLSFLWSKTGIGPITVDFHPSIMLNRLIIPLFFIFLVTLFNNNIFQYEEKRSSYNSVIILNFVTLCLLVSAKNYVQLITAVFISDILGYMMLKNVDSSHRYVIYNFFADMCLFMILALVCGKIQSLELSSLLNYRQIGQHRDFVGLVTATAIFIKIGCFLFQSYLFDISVARFQRMSAVNLLFSPLVGFLLLMKLHNLLLVSNLFLPFLQIMSISTYIAGLVYFVTKDNIQKKMISLNMAFFGILMYLLKLNNFEWTTPFSYYFIVIFFFNLFFFKIYLYQNREIYVSRMVNAKEMNSLTLQTIFVQLLFLLFIFWKVMGQISKFLSDNVIMLATLGILLAVGIVLNHIYKSPHTRRLDYLNPNPARVLSFIFNMILLIIAGDIFEIYNWHSVVFVIIFLGVASIPLWKSLRKLYEIEWMQTEDVSKTLFSYTLVSPLKYISRILWLMVDFIFSEKIITAAFSSINKYSVSVFFKINQKSAGAGILFILLGVLIFILSFYKELLQ